MPVQLPLKPYTEISRKQVLLSNGTHDTISYATTDAAGQYLLTDQDVMATTLNRLKTVVTTTRVRLYSDPTQKTLIGDKTFSVTMQEEAPNSSGVPGQTLALSTEQVPNQTVTYPPLTNPAAGATTEPDVVNQVFKHHSLM